jgi:hypothetical protein
VNPILYVLLSELTKELGLSPELTQLVLSAAPGAIDLLQKELEKIDPADILEAMGQAMSTAWRWYAAHPPPDTGDPKNDAG